MELLTTHINADFDALAAVVAAQRLHPEAKISPACSRYTTGIVAPRIV